MKTLYSLNFKQYLAMALTIIGIFIPIYLYMSKTKRERINKFVETFLNKYKKEGTALEVLIPSGICNLKSHKEISKALIMVKNHIQIHPLRKWNDKIIKIGYKKFFSLVVNSGTKLNKNNIDKFIEESSTKNFNKK